MVALTYQIADEYGVSGETMEAVIECESQYVPDAIGDGGASHGLSQIHQPSHPEITLEEANDPEFAIRFLAENLKEGNGDMWTCYRHLK